MSLVLWASSTPNPQAPQALALSRLAPSIPEVPGLAAESSGQVKQIWDEEIATLDRDRVRQHLRQLAREDENGELQWAEVDCVVANSAGLHSACRTTLAGLAVTAGEGCGQGYTSRAARVLADLPAQELFERARELACGDRDTNGAIGDSVAVVLSPEVVAQLLRLLCRHGFTAPFRVNHLFR